MVHVRLAAGFVAAGALFAGSRAMAADITVRRIDDTSVRMIVVEGEFNEGDGETFAEVSKRVGQGQALVAFDSPGGALIAGLQIGQVIRLRHFSTVVPQDATCASACAIAWLAGTPRFLQTGGRVGFHAAFDRDTREVSGVGNGLVGAYLSRLGLSDAAIVYVEQADPDDVTWLSVADARRVGMDVRILPASDTPQPHAPTPEPAPKVRPPPSPASTASREVLPFLVAPLSPEPQQAPQSLSLQASAFASDYFAHWSESNDQALSYFSNIYAPHVMFYGKQLDRPVVMMQKRDYTRRWPVRVYSARADTVRSFCNGASMTCVVTGVVDWDCRNAERKNRSFGSANFSLTISLAQDGRQIVAEAGSVISRTIE